MEIQAPANPAPDISRSGRARLAHNFDKLTIRIPIQKNWIFIIFFSVILTGWGISEYFILMILTGHNHSFSFLGGSLITLWTLAGLIALRALLWNLSGEEIIIAGKGMLKIERKGILRYRSKKYPIADITSMRAPGELFNDTVFTGKSKQDSLAPVNKGSILFRYKGETIQIATGIDSREAHFILDKLKENKILSESNFSH